MKFVRVAGPVYCRYARTAPVINSDLAHELGIEARLDDRTLRAFRLEEGKIAALNVKIRLIAKRRTRHMTCHGKIDWLKKSEESGEYFIGISNLSLSDDEFDLLLSDFAAEPTESLVIVDTVRGHHEKTEPALKAQDDKVIMRDKAVSMPVALIEEIDEVRGTIPFSEFVIEAIRCYLG